MERNMAKEQPQGLALRRNLERLQLELSTINLGIQSYIPGQGINGNWGVPRYGVGEEVHDQTEADGAVFDKGHYSVFNLTVEEPTIDMKHPSRESKAEPVPDPFMSPFVRNLSGPNSSDIHHGEGFSSNALDISKTKGFGTDTGEEKDIENKSM
ncbi:hypothetical protein PHAVU_009G173600 [Phaseolus vulgaris]|uniref:Uncharacterized protein n=1 Tax=Phaseolus vulgaris TaxID=3885 RepID=V7AXI0_PHAVU|nr:hypothetical protein PHAVU_009G173600g [Phaseolus vulgaris]ESW10005.1 hypothetical protein PHAVU_009G173600g [Phaseolus vulgaris]